MKNTLLKINKPLVSVNWLYQHIDATNLVVLNATLPKVTANKNQIQSENFQIKGARFFDIKKEFSIQDAIFPNTALESKNFELKARQLGINNDSCIVVYDEYGIYSSPRVWWLFKAMGYDNVAVLNGGLPSWRSSGYTVEEKKLRTFFQGNFSVSNRSKLIVNAKTVLNALSDETKQIIDARSLGRFKGTSPEPRADIRSGHIPNSKSLPYSVLLNGTELKSLKKLQELFLNLNPKNKEFIFSCGSGITACVLALGATVAGFENMSVYDGSWTEWGSLQHLPIEIK